LLVIARERLQADPILLPEAAISVADGDFGSASGFVRKRSPARESPPEILRFYDKERDYLPGLQRATGRSGPGQPLTIELPASVTAANARILVERTARRADWSRDRLAWRTSELDPAVAPGSIVTVTEHAGRWRVQEWEWRESGIELSLERVVPSGADAAPAGSVDSGRVSPPVDLPAPVTSLSAYELPWDEIGNGDTPAIFAAVSSAGSNWSGAALYVDHGDGGLDPLGPSGRTRSIVGQTVDTLAPGSPMLFDRSSSVTVELLADDMSLTDATVRQLAFGSNRALIGKEIIQFSHAVPLGNRQWRLEDFLRARGGTEYAIGGHAVGEEFVLLDARPILLDPALVGNALETQIVALGRGDVQLATSAIALQGISLRPLFPVHPRIAALADGSLQMAWTRRARGAWSWLDSVETPLHEQAEAYQVTYGPIDTPLAVWLLETPLLTLSPQVQTDLTTILPGGDLQVRQQGSYSLTEPLFTRAFDLIQSARKPL